MPESDFERYGEASSPFGRTPECPPIEQLDGSAPAADSTRAHVEHCAFCQNEIALLQAFEAGGASGQEAASVKWISAELGRRESPWRPARDRNIRSILAGWLPGPPARWAEAAVAACVLIAAGSAVYLVNRRPVAPGDAIDGSVWRSARVPLISPSGDVAGAPGELSWRGVPGATSYHVRLLEVDGTEIWSADTTPARIALPSQVRAQLRPGRSFQWQVVARGAAGPVAESNLQGFHIL